ENGPWCPRLLHTGTVTWVRPRHDPMTRTYGIPRRQKGWTGSLSSGFSLAFSGPPDHRRRVRPPISPVAPDVSWNSWIAISRPRLASTYRRTCWRWLGPGVL